jgi:hypothetical protein
MNVGAKVREPVSAGHVSDMRGRLQASEALARALLSEVPDKSLEGEEGRGNVGKSLFGWAQWCPASAPNCVNATLPYPASPVWLAACSLWSRR